MLMDDCGNKWVCQNLVMGLFEESVPAEPDFLLLEDGDFLLLEDGSKIELE
jgi:hypothetical protein